MGQHLSTQEFICCIMPVNDSNIRHEVTAKSILSWLQTQIQQYKKPYGLILSAQDRIIKP